VSDHPREEGRGTEASDYWPLAALVLTSALAGGAVAWRTGSLGNAMVWMHAAMGMFLVVFALLKIFDLEHFANGFEMYDLLARRVRGYGYVYPFLELTLGLLYLSGAALMVTYVATAGLMTFGALGVILALRRGLDIECPCIGSVLDAPLSTVTLTENLSMTGMATTMLVLAAV